MTIEQLTDAALADELIRLRSERDKLKSPAPRKEINASITAVITERRARLYRHAREPQPPMGITVESIGEAVRMARLKAHRTQAELAELVAIHTNTVIAIEAGKSSVTVVLLTAIAQALDTVIDVIITAAKPARIEAERHLPHVPVGRLEFLTGRISEYAYGRARLGAALMALLENDLGSFMHHADANTMALLPQLYSYAYNEIPSGCWGTPQKVEEHLYPSAKVDEEE